MHQICKNTKFSHDLELEGIQKNSFVDYDNCSVDCFFFVFFFQFYLLIKHPFGVLL